MWRAYPKRRKWPLKILRIVLPEDRCAGFVVGGNRTTSPSVRRAYSIRRRTLDPLPRRDMLGASSFERGHLLISGRTQLLLLVVPVVIWRETNILGASVVAGPVGPPRHTPYVPSGGHRVFLSSYSDPAIHMAMNKLMIAVDRDAAILTAADSSGQFQDRDGGIDTDRED